MKASRRWLPWLLSTGLLLITAATALADGSMGPTTVYNKDRYWDSPSWHLSSGDDQVQISVKCRDESGTNDPGDWVTLRVWRHAGIFPPYSVGEKTFDACRNSPETKTWLDSESNDMTGPEDFHFQIRGFSYNGGYTGSRLIDLIPYEVNWD